MPPMSLQSAPLSLQTEPSPIVWLRFGVGPLSFPSLPYTRFAVIRYSRWIELWSCGEWRMENYYNGELLEWVGANPTRDGMGEAVGVRARCCRARVKGRAELKERRGKWGCDGVCGLGLKAGRSTNPQQARRQTGPEIDLSSEFKIQDTDPGAQLDAAIPLFRPSNLSKLASPGFIFFSLRKRPSLVLQSNELKNKQWILESRNNCEDPKNRRPSKKQSLEARRRRSATVAEAFAFTFAPIDQLGHWSAGRILGGARYLALGSADADSGALYGVWCTQSTRSLESDSSSGVFGSSSLICMALHQP
ncbi:hypothetical protein DFH06DRAFT_1387905 [Mycena polygramma]|nr:hypothetical protein DFH06DRAFT_1387905 [Mycena polygramma]